VIKESDMDSPVVELTRVSRSFGDVRTVRAVNDVSLALRPGECFGLLGRNGAGKSTTLRMIAGLLHADAGTVRIFGRDPVREPELAKLQLGYLAEDQTFPPVLHPADLFKFFAACHPTWDWDFAESLVDRFQIPVDRPLKALSKGQQRQAALVCAVAHRPKLLVLDEPGGGLDPVVRRSFLEEVIGLLANEDTTVIFSSHHLQEIERLAKRIGIMERGRLILDDELDRVREGSCRVLAEIDEPNGDVIRERLAGCISARRRDDVWMLTMRCTVDEAKQRVASTLSGRIRDAQPVSLEDLFISMVG
jgi:ABC-2 type transport system ATP-binding protein